MKIAYVINQYPQTSHSFIRREILALESQGFEVVRISVRQTQNVVDPGDRAELQRTSALLGQGPLPLLGALIATLVKHPARFLRACVLALKVGRRSDRGLLIHFIYLAESCLLLRWLRSAQVAHLHAHFGTNSATVAMLCRALGGPPYSFTVHGPEEFDKPEFLALGEKVHRAAFVVAISSFGKSQLFRWARYEDWDKLQVIRCGVSEDFLSAAPPVRASQPKLVCVARFGEQKGHLLLIQAAALLSKEGRAFRISLIGDGPLRADIEREVSQLGVTQHFDFLGWQTATQVREVLLESRALVLPSFAEGLPVVLMEALALGRPVIATAIAGIPELVETGVDGWVVPAGAVEPLADAMRKALDASSAELERLGTSGAARVRSLHNAAHEAARLGALFKKSAGETKS